MWSTTENQWQTVIFGGLWGIQHNTGTRHITQAASMSNFTPNELSEWWRNDDLESLTKDLLHQYLVVRAYSTSDAATIYLSISACKACVQKQSASGPWSVYKHTLSIGKSAMVVSRNHRWTSAQTLCTSRNSVYLLLGQSFRTSKIMRYNHSA